MARYKEGPYIVVDNTTGASIPKDIENADYRRFLEWKENNTPDPWETLSECQARILNAIDIDSDSLRIFFAYDALRAIEYQLAYTESTQFKAANYTGAVPKTVKSWAEAKNWTSQQACDDIIATGNNWYGLLYLIRDIRLKAKEAVRRASTCEDCEAVYSVVKDQYSTIRGGNAASAL